MSSHSSIAESRRHLPWMLILFFGSGCAALIYEIVWLQLLQLVIGLTTISLGLLLGTFMGGMCLGSLLLSRVISARHHPLRVYALLELGIGIIGIAILFVLPSVANLYTANAAPGLLGIMMRGTVAAICLLPPTLLMGATLPAMSRWVEATPRGVSWLGFFYGGNIAGAVVGSLLAGFYLLRVHDMATATYVAALINGAVALLAYGLSTLAPRVSPDASAPELIPMPESGSGNPATEIRSVAAADSSTRDSRAVYVVIALSGLAALGAEVVWTRLLSLLLGATVYTFSIILAVFLVGLGIGSAAGSFLSRTVARPRMTLGFCQMMLIPAIAWAAYSITQSLPHWPINPTISLSPSFTFQLDLALCFWTLLPAAILWGASFPLALAAVATNDEDPGRLVGGVYAANTVGAILGALGFSLLVIPMGGTQAAERWLMGLSVLSAVVALAPFFRGSSRSVDNGVGSGQSIWRISMGGVATLVALIGVAAWLASTVIPIPWGLIGYGRFTATYGNRLAGGVWNEKSVPSSGGPPDIFATYVGEGLNGSVAVSLSTDGVRSFHSAGKVQASNGQRDMRLQRLLGHISALVHQKPESVLVVACGAGVTAGTFVLHPDVKRIVICDIEPLVPKFVAPQFARENYDVVRDPRTELVTDDGRHFIRTTKEKFDIITSDPVDPWVKGCAALNTVEYYQMCRDHLKPGGVMSLWLPLYESNSETVKSVIATFFKVFPNGILWSNDTEGEGYDAVLFAQAEPTRIDIDGLQTRLNHGDHALVKKSLVDVGFSTAAGLLATYAGQAPDLREWMRDAQINTDANLRLQYLAGLSFNSYLETDILREITRYYKFPEQVFIGQDQSRHLLQTALQIRHPETRPGSAAGSSAHPVK